MLDNWDEDVRAAIFWIAGITIFITAVVFFVNKADKEFKESWVPGALWEHQIGSEKGFELRMGSIPAQLDLYHQGEEIGYIRPSKSSSRRPTRFPVGTLWCEPNMKFGFRLLPGFLAGAETPGFTATVRSMQGVYLAKCLDREVPGRKGEPQ